MEQKSPALRACMANVETYIIGLVEKVTNAKAELEAAATAVPSEPAAWELPPLA